MPRQFLLRLPHPLDLEVGVGKRANREYHQETLLGVLDTFHGKTILFDTGTKGDVLLQNMAKMNVTPDDAEVAVISLGLGTLLLSILGLTVCLVEIVGVWMVKSRVEAVSDAALEAADQSLAFVNDSLGRIEEILKRGHPPVTLLSTAAKRLERQAPEAKEEVTSLLRQLDDTVFQELKSAQSWLDSAHAIAVGVDSVSEAVVTSDYAATRQEHGWHGVGRAAATIL